LRSVKNLNVRLIINLSSIILIPGWSHCWFGFSRNLRTSKSWLLSSRFWNLNSRAISIQRFQSQLISNLYFGVNKVILNRYLSSWWSQTYVLYWTKRVSRRSFEWKRYVVVWIRVEVRLIDVGSIALPCILIGRLLNRRLYWWLTVHGITSRWPVVKVMKYCLFTIIHLKLFRTIASVYSYINLWRVWVVDLLADFVINVCKSRVEPHLPKLLPINQLLNSLALAASIHSFNARIRTLSYIHIHCISDMLRLFLKERFINLFLLKLLLILLTSLTVMLTLRWPLIHTYIINRYSLILLL